MRWIEGQFPGKRGWFLFIVPMALVLGYTTIATGSSLVYRNFIVRYDRGWDILCEPYVVKKNDWVTKILRQKGEIAYQDFREFLGIFKRLNPHIKNVDMIRPGQGIDIPLRKLEHGSLPGQEAGVVTIPFVALTQVTDVIKRHSKQYTVQRGDTVSKLIARKYGRYGSKSYNEGVKLLKAANPNLTDINKIYAGQKLYLPDPVIQEKSWYASMYDTQGDLKKTVAQGSKPPETSKPTPVSRPKPSPRPAAKKESTKTHLAEAAAHVGAQLQAKGTFYLPREGADDFELDLSKHPVLEFGNGPKLVFTPGTHIMKMDSGTFQANWPEIKPVSIDAQATAEQYVSAIFKALEEEQKKQTTEEVTFERQGVHVAVRAKWIRTESQGINLCVTPISGPEEQTPESIKRYLEQNGIILREIMPGVTTNTPPQPNQQRHNIKNILAIASTSQTDFVKTLANALGFTYVPNTSITFPYAGIQVEAFANLLSTKTGQEILVDFGDLYGDAVAAIQGTGLKVVRITEEENYDSISQKIFSALALNYEQHPTLLAAQRPGNYNTAITIHGILYSNENNKQTLLTGANLHSSVTDMLSNRGIDVIEW